MIFTDSLALNFENLMIFYAFICNIHYIMYLPEFILGFLIVENYLFPTANKYFFSILPDVFNNIVEIKICGPKIFLNATKYFTKKK